MNTQTQSKWFYKGQEMVFIYLSDNYGEQYKCLSQDVNKLAVYETYRTWNEQGTPKDILFVIHNPGLIHIYDNSGFITY